MTPEAQRIAIAVACGWKGPFGNNWLREYTMDGRDVWAFCGVNQDGELDRLPNYLTDLNAMHEAEGVLTPTAAAEYATNLFNLITNHGAAPYVWPIVVIRATAAQRAEAFLKTIGKWQPAQ